jgi:glycosyltransferase involved in cell wall biosynthesis
MAKVSILIPSRNETCVTNSGRTVLQQTVSDVLQKATGDFEVLVMFDGEPYQELPEDSRLFAFYNKTPVGSKICINTLVELSKGKYIFKLDSHCMVSEGFDETLQSPIEDNWVVTPRFYILNAEEWKWQNNKFYDYFYLPCPLTDPRQFRFQAGGHWKGRTDEKLNISLDENMKLHGSSDRKSVV